MPFINVNGRQVTRRDRTHLMDFLTMSDGIVAEEPPLSLTVFLLTVLSTVSTRTWTSHRLMKSQRNSLNILLIRQPIIT